MNDRMYADAATQANLATLRERGVEVIEPDEGRLASRGEHGTRPAARAGAPAGRGSSGAARRRAALGRPAVLVTAGGTREPIDPVRFLGNRSSGRMGIALADAAARRGAEVTLIAANVALPPAGVRRIDVETAAELAAAAAGEFPAAHVLLMAAAPADFRRPIRASGKMKREDGLELRLEPTEDILAALAAGGDDQMIVGFAAEHGGDASTGRARSWRARAPT